MNRTGVKVCGITTPEDGAACFRLGADYLGVIFAESPRKVSEDRARAIRDAVPEARVVGVFVDTPRDEVDRIAARVGLDLVQLHGRETVDYCNDLAVPVIKALPYDAMDEAEPFVASDRVKHLLFDLEKGTGGSEAVLPRLWERAARVQKTKGSVFLAGKLNLSNVARAVAVTRPHAVDVCSGVESGPGVKDLDAVERFIREVKECR